MTITFVSNFMNHHQAPFAEAMIKQGVDYQFVAIEEVPDDRINMGYSDDFNLDNVINLRLERSAAMEAIKNCDFLMCTFAGLDLLTDTILDSKIVFIVSERLFKPEGGRVISSFRNTLRRIKYFRVVRRKDIRKRCYFLLLGDYAVSDFNKVGVNLERMLKFGYFPMKSSYKDRTYISGNKIKLLWVGRLVEWKHPEMALKALAKLNENKINACLTYVGIGKMETKLRKQAEGLDVKFVGSVPFNEIREYMHDSDIYLFTSGYGEGWGCVLNESMSEGCVVIASRRAGSTTLMIEDKVNGYSYDGTWEDLERCMDYVIEHKSDFYKIGKNARLTIENIWNADVAAENLILQCRQLIAGKKFVKLIGPCEPIIV